MADHSDHDSGHDSGDAGNYIRKHAPRGMTVKKNIMNRINYLDICICSCYKLLANFGYIL